LSRSYHVSSILVLLQTAGVALPAWLGYGLEAAAAASCIVTGATLIAVFVDLCLRYPDITWKLIWPSIAELRQRVLGATGYLVSPVATTIMVNGPNLILANSGAPPGTIALFATTRTIAGVARQLPYQFAHPAGVELAGLLARNARKELARVYENASRALAVAVGMLSGATVVVAPLVMMLWTRGKVVYDADLMLLLVGTTVVCAPAQVAVTFLWYGGRPGQLNKALAFSTVLAMGLAILLAPWFQARGVAAGLGVGEIAGIAVYLSLLGIGLRGSRDDRSTRLVRSSGIWSCLGDPGGCGCLLAIPEPTAAGARDGSGDRSCAQQKSEVADEERESRRIGLTTSTCPACAP
jgi:O-antigen/teichoic acid export membrane protein